MAALLFCAVSLAGELYDLTNALVHCGFNLRRSFDYVQVQRRQKLFYQHCREVWLSELEKCSTNPKLSEKVERTLAKLPRTTTTLSFLRSASAIIDCFVSIENMKRAGIDFAAVEASPEAFEVIDHTAVPRRHTGVDVADFMDAERRNFEYVENYGDIEIVDGKEIDTSFYEYADTLPAFASDVPNLNDGCSLTFTGSILPNCERFSINFINNSGDVVLHINPRLPQNYIVRNTKAREIWGREEVASPLPFSLRRGDNFTIQVLVTVENYMISVNGYHFAKYYHRLPYSNVCRVEVKGDVTDIKLQSCYVDTYPDVLPESKAKEIPIVMARRLRLIRTDSGEDELDVDADSDGNEMMQKPSYWRTISLAEQHCINQKTSLVLPYRGCFPIGSMVDGTRLVIEGRIKVLPHSFYINLQHGPQHWPHPVVAFHFNPRFSKQSGAVGKAIVCRNSWNKGEWAEEERSELDTDLRPGKMFCLSIWCGAKTFKVYVNRKFLTEYEFRVQPDFVDTVYIQGDIKLWNIFLQVPPSGKIENNMPPRNGVTLASEGVNVIEVK